jgi:hypothetical protein
MPFTGGGATFNNLFPGAVAEGAGRATSSPSLMSSELLASYFGLVSFTGQLGQDKVTTYGGQLGLNVAF